MERNQSIASYAAQRAQWNLSNAISAANIASTANQTATNAVNAERDASTATNSANAVSDTSDQDSTAINAVEQAKSVAQQNPKNQQVASAASEANQQASVANRANQDSNIQASLAFSAHSVATSAAIAGANNHSIANSAANAANAANQQLQAASDAVGIANVAASKAASAHELANSTASAAQSANDNKLSAVSTANSQINSFENNAGLYSLNASTSSSAAIVPATDYQSSANQILRLANAHANDPAISSLANVASAATVQIQSAMAEASVANSITKSATNVANSAAAVAANAQINSTNSVAAEATFTASSAAARAASDYNTIVLAAKAIFSAKNAAESAVAKLSADDKVAAEHGLSDAKDYHDNNSKYATTATYNGSYDSYQDAYNGGKNKRDLSNVDAKYKQSYLDAYKDVYKVYLSQMDIGRKVANRSSTTPESLAGKSAGYIDGYVKAFNAKLKKHPLYFHNTRSIYVYTESKFSRDGRIAKYKRVARNKVHQFKVKRIEVTKNGLVRYFVNNHLSDDAKKNEGYITANPKFIVNAYYQKDDMKDTQSKTVKVIGQKGIRVHRDISFKNGGKHLKPGTKLKMQKVVSYKGLTRFYIGDANYITSNKKFVKFI